MDIFNFFRKKAKPNGQQKSAISMEEITKSIMEQQTQKSPSDQFASGPIFDICRQNRDIFLQAARSNNALTLLKLYVNSYALFLDHPEIVGFPESMVRKENNDTNPGTWNADIFNLEEGDYAALLFIPVQNDDISARIVGIIFSDKGDGYYYCMLSKKTDASSAVNRNKARLGIEKVGEVKGIGFELMNDFVSCIKRDFYDEKDRQTTIVL